MSYCGVMTNLIPSTHTVLPTLNKVFLTISGPKLCFLGYKHCAFGHRQIKGICMFIQLQFHEIHLNLTNGLYSYL